MRLIDADRLLDRCKFYHLPNGDLAVPIIDVQHAPTIEPERNGEWIEVEEWTGDVYYDCSVCGNSWTTIDGTPWDNGMKFCPHCGARMDGENND